MATKTITIDLEAYRRLKQVQKREESFSQTIKRAIAPPFDLEAWLQSMRRTPLSEEATRAIREVVRRRRVKSRRSR